MQQMFKAIKCVLHKLSSYYRSCGLSPKKISFFCIHIIKKDKFFLVFLTTFNFLSQDKSSQYKVLPVEIL